MSMVNGDSMKISWKYLWGVGIGLLIAWITGAIAYFKAGTISFPKLIIFEVILSIIFLIIGFILKLKS